jgi:predicted flap endonuclease-1-like 5' DNA nuclease
MLKGCGPAMEKKFNNAGITTIGEFIENRETLVNIEGIPQFQQS